MRCAMPPLAGPPVFASAVANAAVFTMLDHVLPGEFAVGSPEPLVELAEAGTHYGSRCGAALCSPPPRFPLPALDQLSARGGPPRFERLGRCSYFARGKRGASPLGNSPVFGT